MTYYHLLRASYGSDFITHHVLLNITTTPKLIGMSFYKESKPRIFSSIHLLGTLLKHQEYAGISALLPSHLPYQGSGKGDSAVRSLVKEIIFNRVESRRMCGILIILEFKTKLKYIKKEEEEDEEEEGEEERRRRRKEEEEGEEEKEASSLLSSSSSVTFPK